MTLLQMDSQFQMLIVEGNVASKVFTYFLRQQDDLTWCVMANACASKSQVPKYV